MNFMMTEMPNFVRREIEQLQNVISPLMKKVSKYMLWTLPLITISILNLILVLFIEPHSNNSITSIIIYSILGAIGMALLKETKIQKKEIQKLTVHYIIARIKKSEIESEYRKREYITLVKKQPVTAINHFINFLLEENNHAKRTS